MKESKGWSVDISLMEAHHRAVAQ